MLIHKTDILDKFKSDRLVIGYELGEHVAQISYCYLDSDTPETLSTTAGAEQYSIPVVLFKRQGVGQWFYGKEALKHAEQGEGLLIENLPELARKGEPIIVEEMEYDPVALLTLFVKRSLTLLSMVAGPDKIEAMMFTCASLESRTIEVLSQVAGGLGLKTKKIFFQSYLESFYYYMLYQPIELWKHQVLLCDYREDFMRIHRMECNKRTTPVVAYIDTKEYPDFICVDFPEEEEARQTAMNQRDDRFLEILTECCRDRIISSVFLIGDGFKEDWMQESIRFLCHSRRVFRGNNLYSKGACLGMKEKLSESDFSKGYVFLGEDKLKANIGMKVLRRGVDSYFALLDAGQNWYDGKKQCQFLLESGNHFELLVTPLNGRDAKLVEISLDGLPERPNRTTRVQMNISLKNENTVILEIEDLGFGEFFPSTGKCWQEEFEI